MNNTKQQIDELRSMLYIIANKINYQLIPKLEKLQESYILEKVEYQAKEKQ